MGWIRQANLLLSFIGGDILHDSAYPWPARQFVSPMTCRNAREEGQSPEVVCDNCGAAMEEHLTVGECKRWYTLAVCCPLPSTPSSLSLSSIHTSPRLC